MAAAAKARTGIAYYMHPTMTNTREARTFRCMQNQYHLGSDYIVLDSSTDNTATTSGSSGGGSSMSSLRRKDSAREDAITTNRGKQPAMFKHRTTHRALSNALAATESVSAVPTGSASGAKLFPASVLVRWRDAGRSRSPSPTRTASPGTAWPAGLPTACSSRGSVTPDDMRELMARATRINHPEQLTPPASASKSVSQPGAPRRTFVRRPLRFVLPATASRPS